MNGSLRGVPVSREPIWFAPKFPTAVKGPRRDRTGRSAITCSRCGSIPFR